MEAVVLAGGLGTRLRSVVKDRPKALADVAGRPFLDFLLEYLTHSGVERVVLSVCHKKEQIRGRYGGRFGSLTVDYSCEEEPLGTGGAVRKSLSLCRSENVFVLNGDSLFFVPLRELKDFHDQKGAAVTLAVRRILKGSRYGSVLFDRGGRVRGFAEKKITGPGFINGGVYRMHRAGMGKVCEKWTPPFSLEKDVFPEMIREDADIRAFPAEAFFIDIGVPESLEAAQAALPARFPIKDSSGGGELSI